MDLYLDIKARLEALRSDDNAMKMAAYMRDKFMFYGVATPQRRIAYKDVLMAEKKRGSVNWNLLDACWQDEHREFQYFALDYLSAMQRWLTFDDIRRVERYVRSKQWWDTIDGLDTIIGKIGLADSRVSEMMLDWSLDDDFWVRRVAIDHQLCRKDKTDAGLLARIIENNLGSREFFINKAIGWSLREYSKTNPEWVRGFIENHRAYMHPLSIREASKYL